MNMHDNPILLTHAFFLCHDTKQVKEKFKPYPPLATLYVAASLREEFGKLSFFDAILAEGIKSFERAFLEAQPRILIIYEDDFNFLSKMCLTHVRDTTLVMAKFAKDRGAVVVVHSSDASDKPEIYLNSNVDYVVAGEGDKTLVELCRSILTSQPKLPDGVISLEGGSLRHTRRRNTMRSIEALPQPAWDLINHKKYRSAWENWHGMYSVNMVTTRGCPYKCNWCAKPIWGQQYVSHTPEYIADQLQIIKNLANPDHIWFADDIFGLKKGWIKAFSRLVTQRGIKTPFMIQSRADLIDEESAKALAEAGCCEVWLGVESGSQKILDAMDKGLDLTHVEHARKVLHKHAIKTGFFIQLGYPGEDIREIELTRRMLIALKPDDIGVSVSYPLPGTEFHKRVEKQIQEKTNWVESNDLDTVFNSTFKAEFYRRIRNHLHELVKEYQQNPASDAFLDNEWAELIANSESYRNQDVFEPLKWSSCTHKPTQEVYS